MLSIAVVVGAALLWLGLLFGIALCGTPAWRAGPPLAPRLRAVAGGLLHLVDLLRHRHPGRALATAAAADLRRHAVALRAGAGAMRSWCGWRAKAPMHLDRRPDRDPARQDAWLAAAVTRVAALGLIPYIALQLKAVP